MSSLIELLSQNVGPEQVQQIAQRIGASPEQTEQAIGLALPTLLGAFARHADDDNNAAQLHAAVGQHDTNPFDDLGSLNALGGTQGSSSQPTPTQGLLQGGLGDILGTILGGRQSRVEAGIGKASGLNASQVASLLAMLAPLILSVLNRRQRQTPGGTKDLQDTLRKERTQMQNQAGGSLLGGLLDQDGDGDFDMQDVLKFGLNKVFGKR